MMLSDLNNFIDAKIRKIFFDFNAENASAPQNMIIEIEKLKEKNSIYKLVFIDVSGFQMDIKVGELSVMPEYYLSDTIYISSIIKSNEVRAHSKWVIELIDDIGNIIIFADDLFIE